MKTAIEIYNPRGTTEVTSEHAPRLNTLDGKTICEISNGGWEADRIFPYIRALLKKRFPNIKIIPYTEFPSGRGQIDIEKIGVLVKNKGCDGVIVGNAA